MHSTFLYLQFIIPFIIIMNAGAAFAIAPAIDKSVQLGDAKGKPITCEGYIVDTQEWPGCPHGTTDHHACTEIRAYKCNLVNDEIAFTNCYTSVAEPSIAGKLNSLHPVDLDRDHIFKEITGKDRRIADQPVKAFDQMSIEERAAAIHKSEQIKKQDELVEAEIMKRALLRPRVKISGNIERCRVPLSDAKASEQKTWPFGWCELSSCHVEFLDDGKKK